MFVRACDRVQSSVYSSRRNAVVWVRYDRGRFHAVNCEIFQVWVRDCGYGYPKAEPMASHPEKALLSRPSDTDLSPRGSGTPVGLLLNPKSEASWRQPAILVLNFP